MMRLSRGVIAVLPALLLSPLASPAAGRQGPIRVACVGDSITLGTGAGPGQSYPAQLGRMLGPRWQVANFGVGGTTMLRQGDRPYWDTSAFRDVAAFRPAVVIIMLGTNDSKPWNWRHREHFVADYRAMVEVYSRLPGKPRVFCCLPPPVAGRGNGGINEPVILEQIPRIKKVAGRTKAEILDMHAPLTECLEVLTDNVHPNAVGAARLARTAYKALVGKEFEGDVPPPRRGRAGIPKPEDVAH